MAIVRPFKGVHYNPEKVLLKQVIAPPYDVITPEYRAILAHRSTSNVVNIDLPEGGEDKYSNAARIYSDWKKEEILIRDQEPAIYMYEQEYEYNNRHYVRTGFVGLLKLEKLGEGVVFPHEKTLSGPKKDRLDLMSECKANFSQIFGLYLDPEDRLKAVFNECHQGMPMQSAIDDDKVKHSIWPLTDKAAIKEVQTFMKDKAVYIADGHHRYETALMYRDLMRKENDDYDSEAKPYDFVMMMFVNFYDSGLMIFPTHRVVFLPESFSEGDFFEKLGSIYSITKLEDEKAADEFMAANDDPGTMTMVMKDGLYGLLLNQELLESMHPIYRDIDTYLLQKKVMENLLHMSEDQILAKKGIHFYQSRQDVIDYVAKNGGIGFILKSVSIEMMRQVSESGLVMPQKSTYFYPKLATGLLFNELE